MAKKMLTVSDLTGEPIINDEDVVTIIIHDHPKLDHAVTIDAAKAELGAVKGSKKDFVLIELMSDGGDQRERMVLELPQFEKLFKVDSTEALEDAEHYDYGGRAPQEEPKRRGRPRSSGAPAIASKGPKVDYKTIENAGKVHRGRITEEEKLQIQQNFDKVNENLKKAGEREISLESAELVEKYGLHKLAQERGIIPK